MLTVDFISNEGQRQKDPAFLKEVLRENLHRGRALAFGVIGVEILFIIALVISYVLKADSRFMFGRYLFMYCLMIAANIAFLLLIGHNRQTEWSGRQMRVQNAAFSAYILFMMSWGSAVSLMDQKLYGQIMVYIINTMICLFVFYLDLKRLMVCSAAASAVLMIGLPFFQSSSDVLIGHYINIFVFNAIGMFASRILYNGFFNSYKGRSRLKKANEELAGQIRENHQINQKLTQANSQLLKLSLLDELTGIPNRRSFWSYIDAVFKKSGGQPVVCSIIMIDIDYFKRYNDRYGHGEGDKILVRVSEQINASLRGPGDFIARWGGEEFVYIAFGEEGDSAVQLAEAIRSRVNDMRVVIDSAAHETFVTVSLGVSAQLMKSKDDVILCLKHADKALYAAKSSGRNCVCVCTPEKESLKA